MAIKPIFTVLASGTKTGLYLYSATSNIRRADMHSGDGKNTEPEGARNRWLH